MVLEWLNSTRLPLLRTEPGVGLIYKHVTPHGVKLLKQVPQISGSARNSPLFSADARFDLIIIGGGPGGTALAADAFASGMIRFTGDRL